MSFPEMQKLFENMMYSTSLVELVFSKDGLEHVRNLGLDDREFQLITSVSQNHYLFARTVSLDSLKSYFPATTIGISSAGVNLEELFDGFYSSEFGNDNNVSCRAEAVYNYLKADGKLENLSHELASLLEWEVSLLVPSPKQLRQPHFEISDSVKIKKMTWEHHSWAQAIINTHQWQEPETNNGSEYYAIIPDKYHRDARNAQIWLLGAIAGPLITNIGLGKVNFEQLSEIEEYIIETYLAENILKKSNQNS